MANVSQLISGANKIRGLGRNIGARTMGRMAVGAGVGMYSSRNEEGLGWWGGVAGGAAAGGFLGRYMPKKSAGWIHRQLGQNKNFKQQFLARQGKSWTGTGLGGFARRNMSGAAMKNANRALQYGMIAGVAGMGASLGSSTLRSNRPY